MAGLACARLAIAALDPAARFQALVADGEDFAKPAPRSPASKATPAPCCRPSAWR